MKPGAVGDDDEIFKALLGRSLTFSSHLLILFHLPPLLFLFLSLGVSLLVAFDSTTASNLQWRRYKERNARCEIKSYSGFHWEIIIIFGHIQVSSSISNHHSHSSGRTLIQRLRLRWQWNHNEYEMILIYNGILATSYQDIIEYTNEGCSRD